MCVQVKAHIHVHCNLYVYTLHTPLVARDSCFALTLFDTLQKLLYFLKCRPWDHQNLLRFFVEGVRLALQHCGNGGLNLIWLKACTKTTNYALIFSHKLCFDLFFGTTLASHPGEDPVYFLTTDKLHHLGLLEGSSVKQSFICSSLAIICMPDCLFVRVF